MLKYNLILYFNIDKWRIFMSFIKDNIMDTTKRLNISLKILSEQEKKILKNNIKKFLKKDTKIFLWEMLKNYTCVQYEEAWVWIKDYIKNKKCIMFFNYQDEKEAFFFRQWEYITKFIK